MPVFVDHEQRRRQVVAVASRLIAEAGLDAVTVRDVANAADCSTAIVSHYFHNKKELLFLTYQASIDQATERCDAALGADGLDLRAYFAEIMPLDEERLIEWKIWVAFWAKAVADPDIAAAQRDCVRRTRGNIAKVLNRLHASGALVPDLALADETRRLLVMIMGMAVQVMFDAADWPNERQHALIDGELRKLYRPDRLPDNLADPAAEPMQGRRRRAMLIASE
jgi:AcrR family transcriptional regulator